MPSHVLTAVPVPPAAIDVVPTIPVMSHHADVVPQEQAPQPVRVPTGSLRQPGHPVPERSFRPLHLGELRDEAARRQHHRVDPAPVPQLDGAPGEVPAQVDAHDARPSVAVFDDGVGHERLDFVVVKVQPMERDVRGERGEVLEVHLAVEVEHEDARLWVLVSQEDGREPFPRAQVEEHDALAVPERVVGAGAVRGGGGHAPSLGDGARDPRRRRRRLRDFFSEHLSLDIRPRAEVIVPTHALGEARGGERAEVRINLDALPGEQEVHRGHRLGPALAASTVPVRGGGDISLAQPARLGGCRALGPWHFLLAPHLLRRGGNVGRVPISSSAPRKPPGTSRLISNQPARSSRAHGDDGALSGHGGRVRGE